MAATNRSRVRASDPRPRVKQPPAEVRTTRIHPGLMSEVDQITDGDRRRIAEVSPDGQTVIIR